MVVMGPESLVQGPGERERVPTTLVSTLYPYQPRTSASVADV